MKAWIRRASLLGATVALSALTMTAACSSSSNGSSTEDAGRDGSAGADAGDAGDAGRSADAAKPTDAAPTDGNSEAGPLTASQILTNLGVTALSSPPPPTYTSSLDSGVTVDPSTWQPLKTPEAVFSPRAEIFQAGGYFGTTWNTFFQEQPEAGAAYPASTPFTDDQSWEENSAKAMVSADIDGDGLAEAVVLYANSGGDTNLYLRVLSQVKTAADGGEMAATGVPQLASAPLAVPGITLSGQSFNQWTAASRNGIGTPWFPYLQATRADLDGDGKQEIVVVDYTNVYLLSVGVPAVSGGAPTATLVEAVKTYATPVSSVAAGDLDGDNQDELAVGLATGQYALYDSTFTKVITNPELTTATSGGTMVEVAFGDFLGNSLAQLAVAVVNSSGLPEVHMLDFTPPASAGGAPTITPSTTLLTVTDNTLGDNNSGSTDYFRMLPRAVDLEGTGSAELQILGWIFSSPMTVTTSTTVWSVFNGTSDSTLVDVQVGDVDDDGKQDLVYLSVGQNGAQNLQVIGQSTGVGLENKGPPLIYLPSNHGSSVFGTTADIAVGNFIDDAARVHYAGHSLKFTDPIVIAVLASPPYWSDVAAANPNYANAYTGWATTFGTTSTTETDSSLSVGFSVGAEVDFEHDVDVPVFGFTISKFKASVAFNATTNWEWSSSYQVQKSVQYAAVGGEDNVVFTSVPMDEYQYVVDFSTDTARNPVGGSLYISIPRAYATYMVTRDFFNQSIGSGVISPIDGTVLGETLGQPLTYPTTTQRDALLSAGFAGTKVTTTDYENGPTTVAQAPNTAVNSGTTNLVVTITTGNSETISHDFSLDTSVGAGVGDVTVSVTAGFETGYTATSSTSTGTTFGGTVGYLPTTYYTNPMYAYESGVFAYPHQQPDGKSFWVVDYWVQQ